MEDNNENIFQTQIIAKAKTKFGKPPTRLQKHAPASLQLDQVGVSRNADPYALSAETRLTAIPLLSPLIVSPRQETETEEFRFPTCSKSSDTSGDEKKCTFAETGGWQHPAVAGCTEPSSLFAFFQSKCLLVNEQ
ncbi:hypothetical protein CFOL_v3_21772 [Cephalotus follicularis]|uniref:Uncharacterized protein n=1 Tax=Cephalotus follicularis TaxID=3775 RepID=A0A1Q3CDI7_CEPFO|nr:hypothetical protein CFOL_v3_21772 [Cephalotus follicularis]